MINFLLGRSNTGKSQYIFDEFKKNINTDHLIYYMVPEQMTLEAEKYLTSFIDMPIFNIKIMSFERLAQVILSRVGGLNKKYIDDIGSLMILKYISIKKFDKFHAYAQSLNKTGFLEDMSSVISDFQKSGATPNLLNEKINNMQDDSSIKPKLKEINIFYEEYLKYTKNIYLDTNSRLELLYEKIQSSNFLKDVTFYFDKFFSFNSLEFNVIKALFSQNLNITFAIDIDPKNFNNINECFDITKKTYDTLLSMTKEMNLEYKIHNFNKSNLDNKALLYLENHFSSFISNPYNNEQNSIYFHISENPEKEILNLCENIISLIKDKKYKYSDIRVFCPDTYSYKDIIKNIFDKYEIPFYLDIKKTPLELNISRILFSFFDLFINNLDQKSVIGFFKTSLTDIDSSNYFLLENFLNTWGIHIMSKKLEKDGINESLFKDYDQEQKEGILNSIEYIRDIYNKYSCVFSKSKNTVSSYMNACFSFIEYLNLKEKIENKISSLTISNEYQLASFLSQSWNEIINILNQINTVLADTKISLEDFIKIIYQGLSSKKISTIPPTIDTIIISDINLTRYYNCKSAFFIGFSDTLFSKLENNSNLLVEEDKILLRDYNINLISSMDNIFQEENMNIYHIITKAKNKIYISYPIKDINFEEARMSSYLRQIKKLFPKTNITSDIGKERLLTPNKSFAFENLYRSLEEDIRYNKFNENKLSLANYFLNDDDYREKSIVYIDTLFYQNKVTKINNNYIPSLYNLPLETSITQLERFNGCPFKHFMDYGIKPIEKKIAEIDYIDIGTLLHKSIENFAIKIKNNEIPIEVNDDTVQNEIENIYLNETFLDERLSFLKNNSKKISYKFKKIKKISRNAGKLLLKQMKHSKFKIRKIEEKVYQKNIKINNTGDDNYDYISLRGKVDRIDEYTSKDGTYINIIDYKSSNKDLILSDIYNGLNIQMPVYLYILTRSNHLNPCSIIYFPMIDKFIKTNVYKKNEIEELALKENFKMKGFFLNEKEILEALDKDKNINSSYLDLKPSTGKTTQNNLLEKNELKILLEFTMKSVIKTSKDIINGIIEPKPIRRKYSGITECQYCRYKNICKFDLRLSGFSYRDLERKSTKDTLNLMKGEKDELD